jgi:hypothetical protein
MADNIPRYGSFPITGVPMLEHGLPIQDRIEDFTAYLYINGHINIIDNPYNKGLSIEGTIIPRLAGAALVKLDMAQRVTIVALKQRLASSVKGLTPIAKPSLTSSMNAPNFKALVLSSIFATLWTI